MLGVVLVFSILFCEGRNNYCVSLRIFFLSPFYARACRPARKNLSIGDRNSVTDKIKNFSNLPASPPAHMTLYDTVTQEVLFTYTIKNNCQLLPSLEFIRVRTFLFYVGYVFRELGAVASNK